MEGKLLCKNKNNVFDVEEERKNKKIKYSDIDENNANLFKCSNSNDVINSNIPTPTDSSNSEGNELEMSNSDDINEKKELELYDQINEENEQVASFLECLLEKKKHGKDLNSTTEIENLIGNKSLKLTVDEMYKKIKDIYGKYDKFKYLDSDDDLDDDSSDDDSSDDDNSVINIRKLTSAQRKLLLFFYVIINAPVESYNYEKDWLSIEETFKITDKDIIEKLGYCNLYAPYRKYSEEIPFFGLNHESYKIYFNWDSLLKLNMIMFSNLEVDTSNNDKYFNTLHDLIIELRHMIRDFKSNGYPSKNKNLFDRFVKLQQRFPETYEELLLLEDKDFEIN